MKLFFRRHLDIILIVLSVVLLLVGWFVVFPTKYYNIAFFVLSYLVVGFKVLKRVVLNFIHKNFFDENTLMGVASIGALCLGEFKEAVFVMLWHDIGTMRQSIAVNKSRSSMAGLMDIQAQFANVVENGEIVQKDLYDISKGDVLLIKAGDKVAVDAEVIDGSGSFDTSTITGESVPRYVKTGEIVTSGFISIDGVVYAKAVTDYSDSTVSKILEMVEEATNKKSKTEQFITKFAKVYTPIVCIISLLIFLIPVIFGLDTIEWLKKALVFLVVSCPCALVISVPLSFFGGIGALSRNGVLIKGSNYLEQLSKVGTIAFDKTGTLTNGEFEIVKIVTKDIEENEFISLLYSIEKYSNHALGQTIVKTYKNYGNLTNIDFVNVNEIAGYGISGEFAGEIVCAGSKLMMQENNISISDTNESGSIIYLAKGSKFLGYIVLVDKVREEVNSLAINLKKEGISKTILLSGDKQENVKMLAEKLGFSEYYGDLRPGEKAKYVEELKESHKNSDSKKVMYVGDGINDALVITVADIGVAMGGLGADIAKESADVVILNDDLNKVPKAIKHAKKVMKIVFENISFALCIKFAILILDLFGLATMGMAVFADVGVTILAIINSLRTLKH